MQCPSSQTIRSISRSRALRAQGVRFSSTSVPANDKGVASDKRVGAQALPKARPIPIANSLGDISISNIRPNQRRSGPVRLNADPAPGRNYRPNTAWIGYDKSIKASSLAARLVKFQNGERDNAGNRSKMASNDFVSSGSPSESPLASKKTMRREEGQQRALAKGKRLENQRQRFERKESIEGQGGQGEREWTDKRQTDASSRQAQKPSLPRRDRRMHSPPSTDLLSTQFNTTSPPSPSSFPRGPSSARRTGPRRPGRPQLPPHLLAQRERRRKEQESQPEVDALEEEEVNHVGPSPFLSEKVDLQGTNFVQLFGESRLTEMSPSSPNPAEMRVQLFLERAGGDYRRYIPPELAVQAGTTLGPVRYAQLALARRREAGLHSRRTALAVVDKLAPSGGDNLINN